MFYSIGFSLGDFQQAKARVRRHGGAHRHVTLVHLIAAQTIDETIYEALESNRQIIELILERGRPPVGERRAAAAG